MSYRSKPEAIKCLEENIGENLHDLGLVNEFLKHDTKTEIYEDFLLYFLPDIL